VGAREQDAEVSGLWPSVRDAGDVDRVPMLQFRSGIVVHPDEDFRAATAAEG
jgi:hypothetical protein